MGNTCVRHEYYSLNNVIANGPLPLFVFRALFQYIKGIIDVNVCKLKRKKQAFEIAKINSCCFHTFPVAILEPFGRTPSWRVACGNAKLFNFERYILLNNWSTGYHTGLRLSGFDYLLLLYNISISWLNLFNDWWFYFLTCVTGTWLKPRIEFKALKESWHPNTMYHLAVWGLSC